MAPPTSPPPTISAITEPDPSSDEDLVPNVPYSLQRKRKNPNTPTSQPTSKRRKAIENPTISAQRTSNAVAGPSRHSPSFRSAAGSDGKSNRPPQTSSGSKVKTSRHSMSQPVTKPVAKPLEPPSAARTKVVRRTRGEKQRQRSSFSSDDMPLVPKKKMPPNSEFPSASAPPARNGAFGREKIRDRFQSDKASNASRGVKSAPVRQKGKVAADDIIELSSSDEQPKPVFDPNEIVVILDTDSETEIKKKSKARKRNGIKKAPPDEVVEILDSDDEPARPVAKADISEKKEDANAALSTNQPNGLSALPCFPDPAENEMDLGADIDVGVEDLSLPDGEPGHGLGLSEMSVDSYSGRQPPNVSPDSSGHDHRSLAPQQIAETSAASPRAVNASSLAIERSQVPDDRPAGLQEGRMNERLPFAVPVASLPASLQDQSGILDGVARFAEQGGVLANDWPPASPDFSTAKSRALHSSHRKSPSAPHLRPNGRLEIDPSDFPDVSQNRATPQVQGPSQALSSGAFPVPGAAPSEPPSPTRRALPRRSLPSEVKDASSQSSPYKNMLDRALGTSAATLQQQLGLSLPKLDLRSLPRPSLSPTKKRPPPRTTSPSSSIDPDPTPATKPEGLPVGKKTQIATNLWDQKRMVEDIITTGKHTAQSTSTPSLHPLHRDPLLPAVPPVEEQTSLAPPRPQVKLEEAPLGRNTSLVNNFIDLSISDEEADAPQVQVQATQSSEQATTPSTNQLPQDLRQQRIERARKRMDKLKSYIGASQSTGATAVPSSNSQIPDTNTAPVVARSSGMDVDSSTGDRALSQDRMNEATDDLPAPVLPPPNDTAADMDIDNGSGTPPPLEQPFVSAVVESDLTGSSEREPPADRASPQQPEEAVNSTEPDIAHQRPAAGYERRSYDDQEVYDLEYIGPPAPTVPTISDPDEDAVEDLVAPTSESDDPSGHGDTDALDDDPSSSAAPSERDFLEASDDENSVSPKVSLRRSSRISSASSSDPLDLLRDDEDDDNLDSPISPNDSGLPIDSPLFPSNGDKADPSVEPMTATQYEIITWQSYKQDLGNFRPRVFYAKDLVSPLHDYIHSYGESFRSLQHLRRLFESAIRENTAEDEPDAPAIEIINEVDSEPCPPWEFYYTNRLWLADGIDPPDMSQLVGCDCKGKCDPKSTTCSCLRRQKEYLKSYFDSGFAYDNKGRLRMPGVPIFECNSLCGCDDDECRNRVIQHGRKCHVAIKKTEKKGWGVFATKRIYKGTFIGVYSGEYMRDEDSERRGLVYDKSGRTYLMNCDPYYLKELTDQDDIEYTIDAYHAGNFTRFLNNSCDPNCMVNACYIDEPDIRKPVMTLFSKRDIAAGEELCFSYQGYDPNNPDEEPDADDGGKEGSRSIVNKCYCGAANCRGFMFG